MNIAGVTWWKGTLSQYHTHYICETVRQGGFNNWMNQGIKDYITHYNADTIENSE